MLLNLREFGGGGTKTHGASLQNLVPKAYAAEMASVF